MTRVSASVLREIGKGSEVELLPANTRDFLYLFAKDGQCRRLSIHELPPHGETKHLADLTEFTRRDEITAAIALPRVESAGAQGYLFLVTEQGMVKRVALSDLLAAAATDPLVINVEAKDRLRWVLHTQGEQEVLLVSASGQSIRFSEEDVRSMGLAAGGIGGMRLKKGDRVVSAHVVEAAGELVTLTEQGFAKRTGLDQYSSQGRNGGGIVTHKLSSRTGNVSAAYLLGASQSGDGLLDANGDHRVETLIVLQAKGGVKLLDVTDVPQMGRNVLGKQVMPASAGNPPLAIKAATAPLNADLLAAPPAPRKVVAPQPAELEPAEVLVEVAVPEVAVPVAAPAKPTPAPRAAATASAARKAAAAAKSPAAKSSGPKSPATKPAAARPSAAKSVAETKPAAASKTNGAPTAQPELPFDGAPSKPAGTRRAAATKPAPASPAASAPKSAAAKSPATKTTSPKPSASKPSPSKPSASSKPSSSAAKPEAPPAAAQKPAPRKGGKLNTVTTVKKPKPKPKT